MPKYWDFEDDHDWDDNIDYKEKGYVYWYGKYYPKEQIDKLFDEPKSSNSLMPLLALGGAVAGVYGVVRLASIAIDKTKRKARSL
ncbi:hypothetical protein ACPA0F_07835 [Solibacillus silvestris]